VESLKTAGCKLLLNAKIIIIIQIIIETVKAETYHVGILIYIFFAYILQNKSRLYL
jgi:hypothetical protein